MFGLGRKKPQETKTELLEKRNIRLGCKGQDKETAIRQVGAMLHDSGYVNEDYVEAMLKRELTFATCIGNGIALPHGVEEAKKDIRRSGIAVMVYPDGINWGNEDVKLVIGIAGAGEEHLEILATIADKLSEPEAVERLLTYNEDQIYELFTGKGAGT